MSSAKPNDPEGYPKPYLVLMATDRHKVQHETQNKGGRKFDTEKQTEVEMRLTPISQPEDGNLGFTGGRMRLKATGDDEFPLSKWKLEAGKYKLGLIGTIHFKYINHNGEPAVFEEAQVDLTFMLEVEENKNSPIEEDSDSSSLQAYYTEAELR